MRVRKGALEVHFQSPHTSQNTYTHHVNAVSMGMRFTTLPEISVTNQHELVQDPSSSRAPPLQPPTTITAVFNPITGHILTAYAARTSRDVALCSRFSFNIHSYESEWTMGGEWWMRRRKHPTGVSGEDEPLETTSNDVSGVLKARLSTSAVSIGEVP